MNFINLLIALSLLFLVSCSGGSNNEDIDAGSDIEIATDGLEGDEIDIDEEGEEDLADLKEDEVVADNTTQISGEMGEYTVESGDTLMLIAFKIYGNYSKWRELQNMNPISATNLSVGSNIKYGVPSTKFNWNPSGNPHLIMRGETLGTISTKYYNTNSKWRNIWDNNRPMIQDPNLIFAGFTIFYPNASNLATN